MAQGGSISSRQVETMEDYKALAAKVLMPNYGPRDLILVRGKGARVWDIEGREYLDFLAGISVCSLGHCHDAITQAIIKQAQELVHCSNLYIIPQQLELARKLCDLSFAEKCFFANSGAEMNEGAIKIARLYSLKKFGEGRYEIITMLNSFHGRTIATISATGQEKVQKGFQPLLEGFRYAKFNDLESVRALITKKTCAIMLEPVQGEGGVTAATPEFLRGLRALCDEHKLLLIYDEVQCGMGRCGKLFAYQMSGVTPDLLTLAKALGNGYPIGALLTTEAIASVLTPGSHGTTFGGNPLACAVGNAVIDTMVREHIPERAGKMGEFFRAKLREKIGKYDNVREIRGAGLMIGVELTHFGGEVVKQCTARGLLLNCTMGNVIRMLPALIVTEDDCVRAAGILAEVLALPEVRSATATPNEESKQAVKQEA